MKLGRPPLLTAPAVRAIRRVYDERRARGDRSRPGYLKRFASRYDVSPKAIQAICRRETYRWVQP